MVMQFTKEEKEKLDKTFKVIVEDLRSLFNVADTNKISYEFDVWENENHNKYSLVINKKEMYLTLHYSDWYMNLEKITSSGKEKMCPIKDYNLVFLFLQKYETIRNEVSSMVIKNQNDNKRGMERIETLFNKYTKEATIEVEMPDTINKSSIEITAEDGKNVGKVIVGPISLRILSSENVKIVE